MADLDYSLGSGAHIGPQTPAGGVKSPSRIAPRAGASSGIHASPAPPVCWLRRGARFHENRFEVVELIGRGGSSHVFRARDHKLDRWVAAKFFVADPVNTTASEPHLWLEARVTARLNHPNIVSVHDTGEHRDVPYIVMDYIDGTPLDRLLQVGGLASSRSLSVIRQVARGMRHAHRRGVLHLDLKPSNVMLCEADLVKIIDFGSAQSSATPGDAAEAFIGTPAYMAPEQWSMGPVDERTDVWGVGVLLSEMVAGTAPNRSYCLRSLDRSRGDRLTAEGSELARSLEPKDPLGAALLGIVRRACAVHSEHRFRDMDELLHAVLAIENACCHASSPTVAFGACD